MAHPLYRDVLRVVSFNLRADDSWRARYAGLAALLAATQADVLALQEVVVDGRDDGRRILRDGLAAQGYEVADAVDLYTHKAWDRLDEHLMILSRHRFAAREARLFAPSPLPRGYIAIALDEWHVVTTHLEYGAGHAQHRRGEAAALATRFAEVPSLIVGDFNADASSPELAPLADAGFRAHGAGASYPSEAPVKAIDWAWVGPAAPDVTVKASALPPLLPGASTLLSDHVGLLVELTRRR